MTTISIAMATFNGARFLQEQLDSFVAQTRRPDELVVSDDGSTDETLAILDRFAATAPFPVVCKLNQLPLGYGENFIRTALHCRGEWIAFSDQDDVWDVSKLERAAEEIARSSNDLMLIAHDATLADSQLHPIDRLYRYPSRDLSHRLQLQPEWHCIGATQVFRADLINKISPQRRVSFPWHAHRDAHDVWVALLANATGSILRIGEPLMLYRRHDATVTTRAGPTSWRHRFHNHGASYKQRADYLSYVAAVLDACGNSAPDVMSKNLHEAAEMMRVQSAFLRTRGKVYSGNRLSRLGSIGRLIIGGGYFGSRAWPFGPARLLKDLLFGFVDYS